MLTMAFSSADDRLVRRLEFGHADSGLSYARACLEQEPESEIAFEQIAGGWAIYQGTDSAQTQALAIGMNGTVTSEEMCRLEAFFHSRGAPAVIDLASMADASVLSLLQGKSLTIREIGNVMARQLRADDDLSCYPSGDVELVPKEKAREWARLVVRGFSEQDEVPAEQVDLVAATPPDLRCYLARRGGEPAAAAAMSLAGGLATLVGDATLAPARRAGLQLALIAHRLREATTMGCDLASVTVIPGGSSHRNYERAGFQLVYSRIQVAIQK